MDQNKFQINERFIYIYIFLIKRTTKSIVENKGEYLSDPGCARPF